MLKALLCILLVGLGQSVAVAKNEVTLHFYPSYYGLNWKSPRSLLKSLTVNSVTGDPHPIGHVNVELTCDGLTPLDGEWPSLMGTTNLEANDPRNAILKEGYGYAVMFTTFRGRFFTKEEVLPEQAAREKSGHASFLTLKVSEATCARLTDYLAEYRRRGYGNLYGLPNRPRKGEGAGCSAFGASFLDVAGALPDSVAKEWQTTMDIGEDILGGPTTGNWIYPAAILVRPRYTYWTVAGEPYRSVTFFDPHKMHDWALHYWEGTVSYPKLPSRTATRGNVRGLVVDGESIPTPTDALFD